MRDLKKTLVKLGSENPDLRPHLKAIIDSLGDDRPKKVASFDIRERWEGEVRQAWESIGDAEDEIIEDARDALKTHEIHLESRYGRAPRTWIDWTFRGSGDGLMVAGQLYMTDRADLPRGQDEIQDILDQTVGTHLKPQHQQPDDPRKWFSGFGWPGKVR